VRIVYSSPKYGTLTSNEVTLTVWDACYNNTVTVVEVNEDKNGSVDVSMTDDASNDTKDFGGIIRYKEKTIYTVTVSPGNGVINGYNESAQYVKSIVITDKNGNVVPTSELKFQEAKDIFGISYTEPTGMLPSPPAPMKSTPSPLLTAPTSSA